MDADPDFERLAPTPLNTICFRAQPAGSCADDLDALNRAVLEEVNASGEVFLSSTRLKDHLALRVTIGHIRTEERHVSRAWELIRAALRRALAVPTAII